MEVEVNEEILRECMEKTRDVSNRWRDIGVLLKVEEEFLRTTEINNPRNSSACIKRVLRAWLPTNSSHYEEQLENALRKIKKKTRSQHWDAVRTVWGSQEAGSHQCRCGSQDILS